MLARLTSSDAVAYVRSATAAIIMKTTATMRLTHRLSE
jgi:hypothetical protein